MNSRHFEYEITFPNVIRIDRTYQSTLQLNISTIKSLELNPFDSITEAELSGIIAGKPNPAALSEIDLKEIAENLRIQSIIFRIASAIYNAEKKPDWKGSKESFLIQLINIIEQFIASEKIVIANPLFNQDLQRRKILIILNMNKVIQHIWNEINAHNTDVLTPVFDKEHPIRSTGDIRTWWTNKPCERFSKTHINFIPVDSSWEYTSAKIISESSNVVAFIKNDHLNFSIFYNFQGVIHKYFPDFIVKMKDGSFLVLEVKGQDDDRNKTKQEFLKEWCQAVNKHGGFGTWKSAIAYNQNTIQKTLEIS